MEKTAVTTLLLACGLWAQSLLDSAGFASWQRGNGDFIVFDVRGDSAPDSVNYPCFYTTEAVKWADSLSCRKLMLVVCHNGILARRVADSLVAHGFSPDSVFYNGYNQLTAGRRPASDTLPLSLLQTGADLPQSLSAAQLWALRFSKRNHMIIDIRTRIEAEAGMVPGACNFDWRDSTAFKAACVSWDRSADIVLYCATGNRAGQARAYLLTEGFDSAKVVNFGGFSKWTAFTGPVSNVPSGECSCLGIEQTVGTGPLGTFIAFPNPFNPSVTLRLRTERAEPIFLEIMDITGKKVFSSGLSGATLEQGYVWNPGALAQGVYLARATTNSRSHTLKVHYRK